MDFYQKLSKRIFGNSGISIKFTSQKGRHVITERDLKAGEIVFISEPYTQVVHEDYKTSVCSYCFKYQDKYAPYTLHCEECSQVWYCSEACRSLHFKELHHYECHFLKKLHTATAPSDNHLLSKLRHVINMLCKRKAEESKWTEDATARDTALPTFADVQLLVSHRQETLKIPGVSTVYAGLYERLKDIMGLHLDLNLEECLDLLSRMDCNQFGIWSHEDLLLGLTVHPHACFFNHSCLPNCIRHSEGRKFLFTTLYPIPKGSELNISYISADLPTAKRQQTLKGSYFFQCVCPRCNQRPGAYPFPPKVYDEFFFKYLKCPKGPGLLRVRCTFPDHRTSSNTTKRSPLSKTPSTENRETDEIEMEERICGLCGYSRVAPAAPSIREWCKSWTNSSAPSITDPSQENVPRRQTRRKRKKRHQHVYGQELACKPPSSTASEDRIDNDCTKLSNISLNEQNDTVTRSFTV
jgi:hypothetical protein